MIAMLLLDLPVLPVHAHVVSACSNLLSSLTSHRLSMST